MEKREYLTLITLAIIMFSLYLPTLNRSSQLSPEAEAITKSSKVPAIENTLICKKDFSQTIQTQETSRIFESQYDLGDTSKYHELACHKSLAATQAKADALEKSLESCKTQSAQAQVQCSSYQCTSPCSKSGPTLLQVCAQSKPSEIVVLNSEYSPDSKKTYCKIQATSFTMSKISCSCE